MTLTAFHVSAAEVRETNGNIIYIDERNIATELTNTGLDSDPSLSPDRTHIVFIRNTPNRMVNTVPSTPVPANEIWIMATDGSHAYRVLQGHAANNAKHVLADLSSPVFSPDGQWIYFVSEAFVTSGAIHRVSVDGSQEQYITAGQDLRIVPKGKYKGYLMVTQHHYFLGGGAYDWVWLVSPTGQEIDPIGVDETSIPAFEELYEK